jgi:hypothetical protein
VNKKKQNERDLKTDSRLITDLKTHSELITELTRAIGQLLSGSKKPEELEGITVEARALAQKWYTIRPDGKRGGQKVRLCDGTSPPSRVLLLALVVLLRPYQELLERIHRYLPGKLENLITATEHAERRATWDEITKLIETGVIKLSELTPKQKKQESERKRRTQYRSSFKSIEYQFGGGLETNLRKQMFFPVDPFISSVLFSMQNCLDDIFAGEPVKALRLEELFRMDRRRFAEPLRGIQKRRCDYVAVVKIMDFLLKKRPRQKRKQAKPGAPPRMPWLNGHALRTRVLSGIEARIGSPLMPVSAPDHIKAAFVAVIRRRLPDSGEK